MNKSNNESKRYKTGDICPQSGKYILEETSEEIWHEKGDRFSSYKERRAWFILKENNKNKS